MKEAVGLFLVLIALNALSSAQKLSESQMKAKLDEYTKEALLLCNKNVKANWNVATDVGNDEKAKVKV